MIHVEPDARLVFVQGIHYFRDVADEVLIQTGEDFVSDNWQLVPVSDERYHIHFNTPNASEN